MKLKPGPDGKPVREYLRDAWRYTPGQGWKRLADLPRAAAAAPSPAPLVAGSRLLVISGDDGKNVSFKPETAHPGFPRDVLAYDVQRDAWSAGGRGPVFAGHRADGRLGPEGGHSQRRGAARLPFAGSVVAASGNAALGVVSE